MYGFLHQTCYTMQSPSNRLFIVSYRLPFNILQTEQGPVMRQNAGGLVSAVLSMAERMGQPDGGAPAKIHWVGHAAPALRQLSRSVFENESFVAHPVFIDEVLHRGFYEGFSNNTLWPLFHYFTSHAAFQNEQYEQYREANACFLDTLTELLKPGDRVWIHDFQLMLLPGMLRQQQTQGAVPATTIGYFHHIPFPTYEIIKLLPRVWRQELLEGLLGADLVGFHTPDYAAHFRHSVTEVLTLPVLNERIVLPNRTVTVQDFPISVDFNKFDQSQREPAVRKQKNEYQSLLRHTKLIFSVDRLDYTKGIDYRLKGYEEFLNQHPEWHNRVTFVMTVVPSRDQIGHYQELKRDIEETVGRINGQFGTIGWRPIVYSYTSLTFTELLALYTACDVALITPIRDGMNLVCKEFVASRHDGRGVLVLSELAGAARELSDALLINPTDTHEVARAIEQGLTMPDGEQADRMRRMRYQVQNNNVLRWCNDFLKAFDEATQPQPDIETDLPQRAFLDSFAEAAQRLLLLDFDGTLAPIVNNPAEARLSEPLRQTLNLLTAQADIVVISGRNRHFLEQTFAGLPVWLVAEHGAFLKRAGADWERLDLSVADWQEPVRSLLQTYVNRFSGSFIEEKETTLAWHYRMVQDEAVEQQAVELAITLRNLPVSVPLNIIQGSKVIEARPAHHSKGTVATRLAEQKPYDFILSIGDDTTDEDMFRALPTWAYTLKVGPGSTNARYRVARQSDVALLLNELSAVSVPVS